MGTLVRNGEFEARLGLQHVQDTDCNVGRGEGIVVATGKSTEFGHVFELMQEVIIAKTLVSCLQKTNMHGIYAG